MMGRVAGQLARDEDDGIGIDVEDTAWVMSAN
jgi:hypothetical protein